MAQKMYTYIKYDLLNSYSQAFTFKHHSIWMEDRPELRLFLNQKSCFTKRISQVQKI